ncbi:MAG TPA: DUF1800 domain-containing protein [Vicinamibacterales bacterium]|nr:DUF1800 domain-containing protein [Vicinamibacterales bacterium]
MIAVVAIGMVSPIRARQSALSETERIVHALNRLGYGPRPGDIDKVRAMTLPVYVEQQLHPERIDDRVVEAKLAAYRTLSMSHAELLAAYPPVAPEALRQRHSALQKRETALARAAGGGTETSALPSGAPLSPRLFRDMAGRDRPVAQEFYRGKLLRVVYSDRQLLELVVDFWMNHFNINYGDNHAATDFENHVVRPLALGRFHDLLAATAKRPAMLEYLDNWLSAAPAEEVEQRLAPLRGSSSPADRLTVQRRLPFLRRASGLNENYARELMELHTLGVDGGYTQQDVIEVAKCFTGWTIDGGREEEGSFRFDPLIHVGGDKVVLGHTIAAGGIDEGEQVLRILSRHPSTARFVSTKLVRRLIADDPPAEVVDAAARTFLRTDGDIREVLRTIITSPAFFAPEHHQAKVKKPIELVASTLRAVNADIDMDAAFQRLAQALAQMGEPLYSHPSPDGFPDVAPAWVNTNALLRRLHFALAVASGEVPGVTRDLQAARSLLREMGVPEPTPAQLARAQTAPAKPQEGQGQPMMMAGESMAMGAAPAAIDAEKSGAGVLQLVVAGMLGGPQFQKR